MYSEEVLAKFRAALEELSANCPGLTMACVATADGMSVASLNDTESDQRIAVMAGTVRSVAAGMAAEAELDTCRNLVIDSENGKMAVLSIPPPGEDLVLAVAGSNDTNLGLLLLFGQGCAERIAAIFDTVPPGVDGAGGNGSDES